VDGFSERFREEKRKHFLSKTQRIQEENAKGNLSNEIRVRMLLSVPLFPSPHSQPVNATARDEVSNSIHVLPFPHFGSISISPLPFTNVSRNVERALAIIRHIVGMHKIIQFK